MRSRAVGEGTGGRETASSPWIRKPQLARRSTFTLGKVSWIQLLLGGAPICWTRSGEDLRLVEVSSPQGILAISEDFKGVVGEDQSVGPIQCSAQTTAEPSPVLLVRAEAPRKSGSDGTVMTSGRIGRSGARFDQARE